MLPDETSSNLFVGVDPALPQSVLDSRDPRPDGGGAFPVGRCEIEVDLRKPEPETA